MKTKKDKQIRPAPVPKKTLGRKLSVKVSIRKDYIRKTDGKSQLYIDISYGGKRKKLYINIYVKTKHFSIRKQRVSKTDKNSKDINILIEKKISQLYAIELEYRLKGKYLSLETLVKEFENPTKNTDFLTFWESRLEKEKMLLRQNTYRQQKSSLKLIRQFSEHIYFSQINKDLIQELIIHFKKQGNKMSTINIHLKNIKKYLHIANDQGIITDLKYTQIRITQFNTEKIFLTKDEINQLFEFYRSGFITEKQKNVLARFMFSIFTGLRISDVQKITNRNISDNVLLLTTTKTDKIQRIPLSKSALQFIDLKKHRLFNGTYSDQHINKTLKEIARQAGIKKRLTFHVARHTFATQWLINGGGIMQLKGMLGHSQMKETMVYAHIVDAVTDEQIHLLDKILE